MGHMLTKSPHALRDFIISAQDAKLGHLFNSAIALLWAFRDIHLTYANLYIAHFTDMATATGGTPYRAYLKKHRDEVVLHQLDQFGDGMLSFLLCLNIYCF
jgi:hypothetical protein